MEAYGSFPTIHTNDDNTNDEIDSSGGVAMMKTNTPSSRTTNNPNSTTTGGCLITVDSYINVIDTWGYSNKHLRGSRAEQLFQRVGVDHTPTTTRNRKSYNATTTNNNNSTRIYEKLQQQQHHAASHQQFLDLPLVDLVRLYRAVIRAWSYSTTDSRSAFIATGQLMKLLRKIEHHNRTVGSDGRRSRNKNTQAQWEAQQLVRQTIHQIKKRRGKNEQQRGNANDNNSSWMETSLDPMITATNDVREDEDDDDSDSKHEHHQQEEGEGDDDDAYDEDDDDVDEERYSSRHDENENDDDDAENGLIVSTEQQGQYQEFSPSYVTLDDYKMVLRAWTKAK
jgi:hypothetical protein